VGEEAFARYAACVLASVNYDGDRRCEVTSELAPYLCRQRTHFKRRALQDNGEALPAPAFFAAEEECLSLAEPTRVELGDEAYRALVECTAAATDLAEGEACLLRACPSDRRPRDDETPTLCTPGS
jgi:hypothetical protein